jgi:hypothetical protein
MTTENIVTENEPVGVKRLREARERLAEMQQTSHETETASVSVPVVQAGDVIHCTDTHGIVLPRSVGAFREPGIQLFRGDTVTVLAEWLEASRDRHGQLGWPAWVHDADEQVRRFGHVRLAPGPAPLGMEKWLPGDSTWREERETARRAAWGEPDPARRSAALAEVQRRYGDGPVTSTITRVERTPSERQAEAQAERIREAAATGTPYIRPSSAGAGE